MVTPIETRYEGCLFRSRLEARWAVFMDTLGLEWRYEPEGFTLSDGTNYLPDFHVKGIGWIEVKPSKDADDGKFMKFCDEFTNDKCFKGYLLAGDIPSPSFDIWPEGLDITARYGGFAGGEDYGYCWCLCPQCGKVGIEFEGRGDRICGHDGDKGSVLTSDSSRILVAYIAARSARFQ